MQTYILNIMNDKEQGFSASIIKAVFYIFSLIYGLITQGLFQLYKFVVLPTHRLKKPVICVGNITLGGVGKTPFVSMIAKFLQRQGHKPAILTRGYKGKKNQTERTPEIISDEALMLNKLLDDVPVMIGKNRVKSACDALSKYQSDVFIMDDGFQHWRVKRDLDIVLIDATNPFGNGHLLPRGILREPLHALRRADLIIITKSNLGHANIQLIKETLNFIKVKSPILEAVHQPNTICEWQSQETIPLEDIQNLQVGSFSSIGNPESFHKTLESMQVPLIKNFVFSDHFWYSNSDMNNLISNAKEEGIELLITTMKDAVKCEHLNGGAHPSMKIAVLNMEIKITQGQDEFNNRINHILRS